MGFLGTLIVVHCEDGIHMTQSLSKVPPPRATNDERSISNTNILGIKWLNDINYCTLKLETFYCSILGTEEKQDGVGVGGAGLG